MSAERPKRKSPARRPTKRARAKRASPKKALDHLAAYHAKRDFKETPEPAGKSTRPASRRKAKFVVQEHHASHLHWDFRLERNGVLVSWAVPKGVPLESGVRRLAIHVEDHPLHYGNFEGVIPEGNYGAGTVKIWDRGTYTTEEWRDGKIVVDLKGERLNGKYHLVRMKDKNWLLMRGKTEDGPRQFYR